MSVLDLWPTGAALHSTRLRLEQLISHQTTKIAALLDDPALRTLTEGQPLPPGALPDQHPRYESGPSPRGSQRRLNWVVRRLSDTPPGETAEATVTPTGGFAEQGWMAARPFQGAGYASEAEA